MWVERGCISLWVGPFNFCSYSLDSKWIIYNWVSILDGCHFDAQTGQLFISHTDERCITRNSQKVFDSITKFSSHWTICDSPSKAIIVLTIIVTTKDSHVNRVITVANFHILSQCVWMWFCWHIVCARHVRTLQSVPLQTATNLLSLERNARVRMQCAHIFLLAHCFISDLRQSL